MTKKELVAAMAEKTGLTKTAAEAALNAFMETVIDEMKACGKVQLVGFGTFEVKDKPEHEGINPFTKEKQLYPASRAPKFKAGKALKDALK